MVRTNSILLLVSLGVTLVPWYLICLAHPLGHDHHEHDGPSPCELRKQYKGEEPVYWPPMHCDHLLSIFDEFIHLQDDVKPLVQNVHFVIQIACKKTIKISTEIPFLQPPEPRCRSATLLTNSPFRGPPLV